MVGGSWLKNRGGEGFRATAGEEREREGGILKALCMTWHGGADVEILAARVEAQRAGHCPWPSPIRGHVGPVRYFR